MTKKSSKNKEAGGKTLTHSDEERYRDLIKLTSDAIWEMDLEARYTYLSANVEGFLGYSAEEMLGKSAYDFMAPEDQEPIQQRFTQYWIERKPFKDLEYLILNKNGRKRVTEVNGLPMFDKNGELIGYRGTCRDRTERHLTMDALRKAHRELLHRVEQQYREDGQPLPLPLKEDAEEKLTQIFKDAQQWYWETDLDHKLTMISGGWSAFAMVDQDWFIGKRMEEVVHRKYSTEVWDDIGALMDEKRPVNGLVFKEKDRSGDMRFVRLTASPRFTADGDFSGYTGWCVDVNEEIKARDEAEIQRKRLLDAVDQMEEGLLLIDADRRVIAYNRSYANHLPAVRDMLMPGVRYEDVLKTILDAGTINEARGREEEWMAERLRAQKAGRKLPPISLVDGTWAQLTEYPLKNGETLLLRRDITQTKVHEEALEKAIETAELANRSKSEFLANMSHELRTPLNAVIGFSDVMAREMFGPLDNETYKDYAVSIRDSGSHLLELISDILDVSRIEAGVMELEESEINLRDLVQRCLGLFEKKASEKGIWILTKMDEDELGLMGDPRRLRQILINLLSNAVKFTPQGGEVTVRVYINNGCLTLTISDSGIGIAPDDLDRVFETFVQLQQFDTKDNEGTGLGLPLTKSLIELHGGTIEMSSSVGEGTTVTVVFPKKRHLQKLAQVSS